MRRGLWLVALTCLGAAVSAQTRFHPAEFRGGALPTISIQAVGGGQVFLELAVAKDGTVADVKPLRATPPFTPAFIAAARSWRFRPAEQLTEFPDRSRPPVWTPVDTTVLVGGIIRPPALLGPTLGQPPQDVGSGAADTPFPLGVIEPPFPPRARDDGSVLVQVMIDAAGKVSDAKVLQSSPAFDDAALTAARAWTFRPARVRGDSVSVYAYLVFGFRQPVTPSRR
jgi:TonB family protein